MPSNWLTCDQTYDLKSMPGLVATIRDLFELYQDIRVLISATVRNEKTLANFLRACGMLYHMQKESGDS